MLIDKITEIFVKIDDFYIEFESSIQNHLLESGKAQRIRKSKLSESEIMTISISFHLGCFSNFKHYYIHYIQAHLDKEFPQKLSYNRFIEVQQKVLVPLLIYLKLYGFGECTGISFMDSTCLKVCHNKRIYQHKVFKGIAQRGKSTMGWFYGFKLHLIINEKGEILNFSLSKGNVDDRNRTVIKELSKNIGGKIFADKGYISQSLFEFLSTQNIQLITGIRKNMKNKLVNIYDKIMLRKRAVIETVNDQLKNIAQIEHSRHRSLMNFLINTIAAITAYCFADKKPSINLPQKDRQIALNSI